MICRPRSGVIWAQPTTLPTPSPIKPLDQILTEVEQRSIERALKQARQQVPRRRPARNLTPAPVSKDERTQLSRTF